MYEVSQNPKGTLDLGLGCKVRMLTDSVGDYRPLLSGG